MGALSPTWRLKWYSPKTYLALNNNFEQWHQTSKSWLITTEVFSWAEEHNLLTSPETQPEMLFQKNLQEVGGVTFHRNKHSHPQKHCSGSKPFHLLLSNYQILLHWKQFRKITIIQIEERWAHGVVHFSNCCVSKRTMSSKTIQTTEQ